MALPKGTTGTVTRVDEAGGVLNTLLINFNGIEKNQWMYKRMLKFLEQVTEQMVKKSDRDSVAYRYYEEVTKSCQAIVKLSVSDAVRVKRDTVSAQKVVLPTTGTVTRVDEIGDVLINFSGIEKKQWMYKRMFKFLEQVKVVKLSVGDAVRACERSEWQQGGPPQGHYGYCHSPQAHRRGL